ncbi:MAG: Fic family protein [Mycoplasmataceae bacterium]|jgi:fido (protein-threonine AMPylation protein)|nr:Fic family protein [Mycoplasmataceae bacterium]
MTTFGEYKKLDEPEKKKKSENWETAIGLQAVDGLKPSEYLIETAKENIDGKISIYEVEARLSKYYKDKSLEGASDRTEEADKVSIRITEILNEKAFSFSPEEIIMIHKKLFEGVLKSHNSKARAGIIRDYNISKNEWILSGKSVYYASANNIVATLNYDFEQEKKFNYNGLSKKDIIEHITQFVSNIWQIHPFGEGNTRTIAVFAIKYLRTLGFEINNDLFKKYSWYFRNALVRANYNNYKHNIYSSNEYLNHFFTNLLINGEYELKNRDLKIYIGNSANNIPNNVLDLIKQDNKVTTNILSKKLNKGSATIKRELRRLKEKGYISRIGSDKTGSWKILKN